MFGFFSRSTNTSNVNLFENNFAVIDAETLRSNRRTLIKSDRMVFLYSNVANTDNGNVLYYEILFFREQMFTFLVYHNKSREQTEQMFYDIKDVLNNFEQFITSIKTVAFDNLRSIMNCLNKNSKWTSTHIAAKIGLNTYFRDNSHLIEELNSQVEPDYQTPLHLAIKSKLSFTVKTILEFQPNLDLLDNKKFSILHYAAISTKEILSMILAQPDMLKRVPWKNEQGCTALHLACFIPKYDNVLEFLKFGLTVEMLTLSPPRYKTKKGQIHISVSPTSPDTSPIVKFTDQDFTDLDTQDIFSAGSPLHWVKHKRLMQKLIDFKFNLNTQNIYGNTPLHTMTKRSRLKCVLTLLCSGANVGAQNFFGDTSLHISVKSSDIIMSQTLIVFDSNINAKNFHKETVRHLAAEKSNFNMDMILYLLSSTGANRCAKNFKPLVPCTPGCAYDGNFEGRYTPNVFESVKNLDKFLKNYMNGLVFDKFKNRSEEELKMKRTNMLTIDGGGIKGLIAIQVMIEIEKFLKHPFCEYFKWIAGTSTGSFIAIFISMRKTLKEIRNTYFKFKDKVLIGNRPYDSELLENIIKEEVGADLKMQDIKTRYNKHVLIPAVLFDRKPMKLHVFRSFMSYHEILKLQEPNDGFSVHPSREQHIWRACRASGAAPTYFKAYGPFLDGGIISNNPTIDALTEFQFYNNALFSMGFFDEVEKLDFVLSLGTGKFKTEENEMLDISSVYSLNPIDINNNIRYIRQMFNLLVYEVCQTENHVVQRAEAFCNGSQIPYIRINPPISELIELDEPFDFKLINALWETKRFMFMKQNEVLMIVDYLEKYTQNLPLESLSNQTSKPDSFDSEISSSIIRNAKEPYI